LHGEEAHCVCISYFNSSENNRTETLLTCTNICTSLNNTHHTQRVFKDTDPNNGRVVLM